MKIKLIFLCFICISFKGYSQELEIIIKEKAPYNLFQDILIEINLKNTTGKPLTYFDSRYTSWDSYDEIWEMKVNGEPIDMSSFRDAHEGKFTENSIITLLPGEKKQIRGRLMQLQSPGHYVYSYTQIQSPGLVKKVYASNASAYDASQKITSFKVNGQIEFDVLDKKQGEIKNIVQMTWEEWKEYKKKALYDNNNYFLSIDKAFNEPEKVYYLALSCDNISEEMLKRVGNFKNLKYLSLSSLDVKEFPKEIADLNLYEIEILTKKGANITYPYGISGNSTVHRLVGKFYNGIPSAVLNLKNLEELDVRYCNIVEFPNLSSLKNLQVLIANDSELKTLQSAGLENLSKLREIDISGNPALTDLSPLTACLNLEVISCNRGSLKTLPEQIGKLSKLQKIDLVLNKELTILPSSFVDLKNLKHLDLDRTGIQSLPVGLSQLPLETLTVSETNCKKTEDYKILKKRLKNNFRD